MATVFGSGGSVASMIAKTVSGNSSAMSRNAALHIERPDDDSGAVSREPQGLGEVGVGRLQHRGFESELGGSGLDACVQ